jgi:mono/diheme cytochrome c family protein
MRKSLLFALMWLAACESSSQPSLSGETLYANNCASCHGMTAEGDGPLAQVLSVSVPNLRNIAARNGGVFPANAVRAYIDGRDLPLAHGDRLMPVWGDEFGGAADADASTEADVTARIDALVEFLEEIQYR